MAQTRSATESLAIRDWIVDLNLVFVRAALPKFIGCAVFSMLLYLLHDIFERVERLSGELRLTQHAICVASPVAISTRLLDCVNLLRIVIEYTARAGMNVMIQRKDGLGYGM